MAAATGTTASSSSSSTITNTTTSSISPRVISTPASRPRLQHLGPTFTIDSATLANMPPPSTGPHDKQLMTSSGMPVTHASPSVTPTDPSSAQAKDPTSRANSPMARTVPPVVRTGLSVAHANPPVARPDLPVACANMPASPCTNLTLSHGNMPSAHTDPTASHADPPVSCADPPKAPAKVRLRRQVAVSRWARVPSDWRSQFSQDCIDLLAKMEANPEAEVDRIQLFRAFRQNRDFILLFLGKCLERRMLFKYLDVAVRAVKDDSDLGSEAQREQFWQDVFDHLLSRGVDTEDTRMVREALAAAHDNEEQRLIERPKVNCPALVAACFKDNLKLLKLLISKGYYLRSAHYEDAAEQDNASGNASGNSSTLPTKNGEALASSSDEVRNLHLFQAMSRPSYLLTRYAKASEVARLRGARRACRRCAAGDGQDAAKDDEDAAADAADLLEAADHPCPDHENFSPRIGCLAHAECNDPIFRAFQASKIATRYASRLPEYHLHYQEVSHQCSQLAIRLLESCNTSQEIETLLADPTGSGDYIHSEFLATLRYPRLQMAIQNNDKDFVGHMYCQEILRRQWQGRVKWHSAGLAFRLLYSVLQVAFTSAFVLAYMTRLAFKDLGITSAAWRRLGLPAGWHDWLCGPCNLDEPINRFISYTGSYIFFCILLLTSTFTLTKDAIGLESNYYWYDTILLGFTLSMLITDVVILVTLRSRSVYGATHFWRLANLIFTLVLTSAFFLRLVVILVHPCQGGEACDPAILSQRHPYDYLYTCLFSLSCLLSLCRLLYWLQLHPTLGPFVINLSRVFLDILSTVFVVVVVILAFTSGLVPLTVAMGQKRKILDGEAEAGEEDAADLSSSTYASMSYRLFWSGLGPAQPDPGDFYLSSWEGRFGLGLQALYMTLFLVAIVNLLIANMNATVQKSYFGAGTGAGTGARLLYWKYVRANIWMDYINDLNAVPQPYDLLLLAWDLAKAVVVTAKACCGWKAGKSLTTYQEEACLREEKKRQRRRNSDLLLKLVERYWSQRTHQGRGKEIQSQASFEYQFSTRKQNHQ